MADAKLKELVKKRATFKAKLTQFVNVLNIYKSCAILSELQISKLECRLSRIDALYSDYDALQANIELQSDQQEDQFAEREQFETQYYGAVSLARTLLAPTLQPTSEPGERSVISQGSTNCRHDFVRLPKIDLPYFDGDYQRWLAFRDTYLSLIHNNNSLSDINKLHYLRAALKGSAALIVHSLELRSDNYASAWQLLSDRYDNPRLLVNNHVQALFEFEPLQKESRVGLRNMIDVTNKNLRALATLGEPTDHWDTLVIYMMSRKLDSISCREWEEYRNTLTGSPTLQHFLKFLNNRADLLETLFNNNKHNIQKHKTPEPSKSKSFNITTDHTISRNAMNESSCPLCSDEHYLYLCPSFRSLSVDSRIKQATAAYVCLNCLRPGHSQKGCRLSHCKYCNIKHNTLLHKEPDTENVSSSAFENNVALSTDLVSANININQGHILLSTALVKVKDIHGHLHTARLLLDNGSTANFITQSLCGKLNLVRRATDSTVSDDSLLTRFWELDSVPAKYHMSSEERLCEQSFEENTRRCKNAKEEMAHLLREPDYRTNGYGEGKQSSPTVMASGARH